MKTQLTKVPIALMLIGFLGACTTSSFYHEKIMSGKVVQVEDNQAVVCIGDAEATKPGMAFEVFEVIYRGSIMAGTDNYRLEKVGLLEIQSIVDGHFARARVVDGSVERHNIIELQY